MKITILGSGTGYPTSRRSACSALMEIGADRLLFDLGVGTMRRLLEAGSSHTLVTHLFFSHKHPDHTGEFASFLFASKYPEAYCRKNPLIAVGKEIRSLYTGLQNVYGKWVELDPEILDIIDLGVPGPGHLDFPNFRVDFGAMPHIESSIGYRITSREGRSAVYTGDTDYSEAVVSLVRGADLLITECSTPEGMKAEGHLTPALAGRIAAEARVGRLVLTHLYPECDNVDIAAQCRATWKGPLTIAEDLMEFQI